VALLLCFTFMIIEFVGGILANRCSLAAKGTVSMSCTLDIVANVCIHGTWVDLSSLCFPCSLAIMTDAAHLLSDVSGFGVSLWAGWYAARKSRTTHTFGYHRVEVRWALHRRLITVNVPHRLITALTILLCFLATLEGVAISCSGAGGACVGAQHLAGDGHPGVRGDRPRREPCARQRQGCEDWHRRAAARNRPCSKCFTRMRNAST
jgi:Cation efflux family